MKFGKKTRARGLKHFVASKKAGKPSATNSVLPTHASALENEPMYWRMRRYVLPQPQDGN